MQTFLTSPSFEVTARDLDDKRLGKQRVEAYQILRVLQGKTKGWRNHPAVLMWYGYEPTLDLYLHAMIEEWKRRGFKNTMARLGLGYVSWSQLPPWFTNNKTLNKVINSHRSNLKRKDPRFYAKFNDVPDDLPYFWPVTKEEVELRRVLDLCS